MNATLHPDRWPALTPANDDAVDDVPNGLRTVCRGPAGGGVTFFFLARACVRNARKGDPMTRCAFPSVKQRRISGLVFLTRDDPRRERRGAKRLFAGENLGSGSRGMVGTDWPDVSMGTHRRDSGALTASQLCRGRFAR